GIASKSFGSGNILDRVTFPEPAGTAERGNAALCRDSRPGEDGNPASAAEQLRGTGEFFFVFAVVHRVMHPGCSCRIAGKGCWGGRYLIGMELTSKRIALLGSNSRSGRQERCVRKTFPLVPSRAGRYEERSDELRDRMSCGKFQSPPLSHHHEPT